MTDSLNIQIEARLHGSRELEKLAGRCRASINNDQRDGLIPRGRQAKGVRGRPVRYAPETIIEILRFYWGDDLKIDIVPPRLSA